MPYMNSQIDLSFPEIQTKATIKLDYNIDTRLVRNELDK